MKKVYVVGIGPGDQRFMTGEALAAIEKSDLLVGYTAYIDLIKELCPSKKRLATGMCKEIERCEMAFQEAEKEQTVSMICSGDAGVYGMAGLMLTLSEKFPEVDVEIVCGVTAALSGAAVLGAPLMHAFAIISLSDLLTTWNVIENRLRAAAQGDFVIVIYNPSSKKRAEYLKRACEILLETKDEKTVCGIVKNIGRQGESAEILTLEKLQDTAVDMFTTVFIGNSETKIIGKYMVTPRGYEKKK